MAAWCEGGGVGVGIGATIIDNRPVLCGAVGLEGGQDILLLLKVTAEGLPCGGERVKKIL